MNPLCNARTTRDKADAAASIINRYLADHGPISINGTGDASAFAVYRVGAGRGIGRSWGLKARFTDGYGEPEATAHTWLSDVCIAAICAQLG